VGKDMQLFLTGQSPTRPHRQRIIELMAHEN